jgi:hypothetical protein
LVVLALVFSIGAHWLVLQSVAWVGMVVSYSQEASVTEAISKTFDGEHPCRLCEFVKEGRKAEGQQQKALKLEAKKDFFCQIECLALCPPRDFSLAPALALAVLSRSLAPALPPPRLSAV